MFLLNGYDPFAHDGRFYYDEVAAERPLYFCRKYLTHTVGHLAGTPIDLVPDHANYIRALFGFKHKDSQLRRFRATLYSAARGNAKTTLSSIIAQYLTWADGEGGAQTFLCASTRDQARLIWDTIYRQMLNKPKLFSRIRKLDSRGRAINQRTGSYIATLSSEATGAHGLNLHCGICDEMKNWDGKAGRDFYSAIEGGSVKRLQPLLYLSSTAAYSTSCLWWELLLLARKIKKKPHLDYSFLPLVYELDDKDDWRNLANVKKANPLWGLGVQPEAIERMRDKAILLPHEEGNFKREHCNMMAALSTRLIKPEDLLQCPRNELDLSKELCVMGLDTSSTTDLTAIALYWPARKYVRVWYHIPGECAHAKSLLDVGSNYTAWVNDPLAQIKFTKTSRIERPDILATIKELKSKYKIAAAAFDPWEGKSFLVDDIQRIGIRAVDFRQNYSYMNAPTKEFERLIATHELNIGQNPCFFWNCENLCVTQLDDFIRPEHTTDNRRNDGAVAAIMALGIQSAAKTINILA